MAQLKVTVDGEGNWETVDVTPRFFKFEADGDVVAGRLVAIQDSTGQFAGKEMVLEKDGKQTTVRAGAAMLRDFVEDVAEIGRYYRIERTGTKQVKAGTMSIFKILVKPAASNGDEPDTVPF